MAEPPETGTAPPKDPEDVPGVMSERNRTGSIWGRKKKEKKPASPAAIKAATIGTKTLGAGSTALKGVGGITGTAAKIGDISRKMLQGLLNPSATGINEANTLMDATQGISNVAQNSIKGLSNFQAQQKQDKLNMKKMRENDAAFIKELEQFREQELKKLENMPFRDDKTGDSWGKEVQRIEKDLMGRLSARGMDPRTMDKNSTVAKWYRDFASELKSKAHETSRDRSNARAKVNLENRTKKYEAGKKYDAKKAELDKIFHTNMNDWDMLSGIAPGSPGYSDELHILSTAMVTSGLGRQYRSLDKLDENAANQLAKKISEMAYDEKDPAKHDAYVTVASWVKDRSNGLARMSDEMEEEIKGRYVGDLNMSADDVLKKTGGYRTSANNISQLSIDPHNIQGKRNITRKRAYDLEKKQDELNRKIASQGGAWTADDLTAQAEINDGYHRIKYDQDEAYLASTLSTIVQEVNGEDFTARPSRLGDIESDYQMRGLKGSMYDTNGKLIPYTSYVHPTGGEDRLVYDKFLDKSKDYLVVYSATQIDEAKRILDEVQKIPVTDPATGKPRWDGRSGLELTIGELRDAGLIDDDNILINELIQHMQADDAIADEAELREMLDGYALGDVINFNVRGKAEEIGKTLMDYPKIGSTVGYSSGEKENIMISLLTKLTENDESYGMKGIKKEKNTFSIPNGMYTAKFKLGENRAVPINGNQLSVGDNIENRKHITGSKLGAIIMGKGKFGQTAFETACDILGICHSVNDSYATKAGNVLEKPVIEYLNANHPEMGTIVPGDTFYAKEEAEAKAAGTYRKTDFENPIFGGKVDGYIFEPGADTSDPKNGKVVEVKITSDKIEDWKNPDGSWKIPDQYLFQMRLYNHFAPGGPKDVAYMAVSFMDPKVKNTVGKSGKADAWSKGSHTTELIPVEMDDEAFTEQLDQAADWYNQYIMKGLTPPIDPNNPRDVALWEKLTGKKYTAPKSGGASPPGGGAGPVVDPHNPETTDIYSHEYLGSETNPVYFITADGSKKNIAMLTQADFDASYKKLNEYLTNGYTASDGSVITLDKNGVLHGSVEGMEELVSMLTTDNRSRAMKIFKTAIDNLDEISAANPDLDSTDLKELLEESYETLATSDLDKKLSGYDERSMQYVLHLIGDWGGMDGILSKALGISDPNFKAKEYIKKYLDNGVL